MIRNKDAEHLKLLSIFHYVLGGLTALFSLFPIIHLILGIAVVLGAFPGERADARRLGRDADSRAVHQAPQVDNQPVLPSADVNDELGRAIEEYPTRRRAHEPFPKAFGWFFIIFASAFILIGETLAICLFIAARSLAHRRRYTFCFVVAVMSCLSMPMGTVLGIFTIIVLCRPTVKTLFGRSNGAPVGEAEAESPYTAPPPPPSPPPMA